MMKSERFFLKELEKEAAKVEILPSIGEKIRNGAVFVYPTETIYGIGGLATDAVRLRTIDAKRRDPQNRFILIAPTFELFASYNLEQTPEMKMVAEEFWPGNLTLVMYSNTLGETVAIRVSNHPWLLMIRPFLEKPLLSTSANVSGSAYINDPDIIFSLFEHDTDFMIDAGILPQSAPSTIIDVSVAGKSRIIREGCISSQKIKQVISTRVQE